MDAELVLVAGMGILHRHLADGELDLQSIKWRVKEW
jgi:hypothetical protein